MVPVENITSKNSNGKKAPRRPRIFAARRKEINRRPSAISSSGAAEKFSTRGSRKRVLTKAARFFSLSHEKEDEAGEGRGNTENNTRAESELRPGPADPGRRRRSGEAEPRETDKPITSPFLRGPPGRRVKFPKSPSFYRSEKGGGGESRRIFRPGRELKLGCCVPPPDVRKPSETVLCEEISRSGRDPSEFEAGRIYIGGDAPPDP